MWVRIIAAAVVGLCAPVSFGTASAHASVDERAMVPGSQPSALSPLPVISRNAPAYTNDTCGGALPASFADDADYDTQWGACVTPSSNAPIYLAYDLSAVPAANRGQVLVLWYNDPQTMQYDHTYVGVHPCCKWVGYAIPSSYTLQGNAAPGGALPSSGWVTLATVSGNVLHSRQHLVDLTGYGWLRMRVTASDGSPGWKGVFLNMDVNRLRLRYMRENPAVALTALGADSWYDQVTLLGRIVSFEDDPDLAGIDRLAIRYDGKPFGKRDALRVSAWMVPERWSSWPLPR